MRALELCTPQACLTSLTRPLPVGTLTLALCQLRQETEEEASEVPILGRVATVGAPSGQLFTACPLLRLGVLCL